MINRFGNAAQKAPTSVSYLTLIEFLTASHLPARLCVWQAAALLGLEPHHLPILIAARLLKPLGTPPQNAPKYFARDYVIALGADERWLARASDALTHHWAERNAGKHKKQTTT